MFHPGSCGGCNVLLWIFVCRSLGHRSPRDVTELRQVVYLPFFFKSPITTTCSFIKTESVTFQMLYVRELILNNTNNHKPNVKRNKKEKNSVKCK